MIKQDTEASAIKLEVGLGGGKLHRAWMTWKSTDAEEFDFPDDYKSAKEIWIKGTASPNDRNVYMQIYYKDRCTQNMEFDDDEEHEVSQGDGC